MSILDMDVTARRDAGSIRSREFATVRKGYDPDQVRNFLEHVASWIDDLETDLAAARAEARAAPRAAVVPGGDADPYSALGTRVADVLRTAEDHAKRIREEAEASVQGILEEARQESLRVRRRAQEESESVREAAAEQAETVRRTAQEVADRVRDEAASALETARVEAERTVAALRKRRNVLAAELHATRSRLMGIVTQLEEDRQDEEQEPQQEPEAGLPPRATSGFIPRDDPRRDPVPPEIPAFVPPPAPTRGPLPPAEATVVTVESIEFPTSPPEDASPEAPADEEVTGLAATSDSFFPPDAPVTTAEATAAAVDPARPSEPFIRWTDEEAPGELDLSLPDFPTIDIPSLEDEDRGQS